MEIVREPKEFLALIPEYNVEKELKQARNKIGNYFILNDKDLNLKPDEIFGFKVMKLQGIAINKDQALRFISGDLKPFKLTLPDWYIKELEEEEKLKEEESIIESEEDLDDIVDLTEVENQNNIEE